MQKAITAAQEICDVSALQEIYSPLLKPLSGSMESIGHRNLGAVVMDSHRLMEELGLKAEVGVGEPEASDFPFLYTLGRSKRPRRKLQRMQAVA